MFFWKMISPLFPFVRDVLLRLGIIWHEPGRQLYRLGYLKQGRTIEDFLRHLESQGFSNHFIAWVDDGERVSLRKCDQRKKFQYHLRIFEDGEVRGHYEYTPEAHPILHFREKGMEERREEFQALVGDWIQ